MAETSAPKTGRTDPNNLPIELRFSIEQQGDDLLRVVRMKVSGTEWEMAEPLAKYTADEFEVWARQVAARTIDGKGAQSVLTKSKPLCSKLDACVFLDGHKGHCVPLFRDRPVVGPIAVPKPLSPWVQLAISAGVGLLVGLLGGLVMAQ